MIRLTGLFSIGLAGVALELSMISAAQEAGAPKKTPTPPELPESYTPEVPLSPQAQKLKEILGQWENERNKWLLAYERATTPKQQAELWNHRPDGKKTAQETWNHIRVGLNSPWVIPGIIWFLNNPVELSKFPAPKPTEIMDALLDSIEHYLVAKPEVKEVCPALATFNHKRSLSILEKIFKINNDPVTKGYAALGIAIRMRLGGASDEPEGVNLRGGYVKYALENIKGESFGGNFGEMELMEVLREELYMLKNLTIDNKPPHIRGMTLDGKLFDTNQLLGKVVVITFWDPRMPDTAGVLIPLEKMYKKLGPKGLQMVIVSPLPLDGLKDIQEKNNITIPIIADESRAIHTDYRAGRLAESILLNRAGLIKFKQIPSPLLEMTAEQIMLEKNP